MEKPMVKRVKLGMYYTSMLIAAALAVHYIFFAPSGEILSVVVFIVHIMFFGLSVFLFLNTLYKMWLLIQPQSTSPKKAIAYLFVPVYNIYWSFFAIYGLSKKMNSQLSQINSQNRISEKVSMAFCVLYTLFFLPIIGIVSYVALPILSIILMHQWARTIDEINNNAQQNSTSPLGK